MKLILTAMSRGLGGPGDLVEVKDGYGRNYLLPQRLRDHRTKGAREAGGHDPSSPASPRRFATWTTPRRSRPQLDSLGTGP